MQEDGNLVLYPEHDRTSTSALWAAGTEGTGGSNYATMQMDGNFVVYTAKGIAKWASGTCGTGRRNRVMVQDDGNLVICTRDGSAIWDRRHGKLTVQAAQA